MKKLLFVIPTMRMGGAEKSLVALLSKIDPTQFDLTLLLFAAEGELLESLPSYVKVISLPIEECAMVLEGRFYFKYLIRKFHWWRAVVRCIVAIMDRLQSKRKQKKWLSWNLYKGVIAKLPGHYDAAISYLEGTTACYVIDKVTADRKIGWIHTDFSSQLRSFSKEYSYYAEFDRLVTISEICRNGFARHYPNLRSRMTVIENLIDKKYILNSAQAFIPSNKDDTTACLVTVGRLEAIKGIDLAIQTAAIMRQRGFLFRWYIYGSGYMLQQFTNMIEQLELQDVVLLEGSVTNPYPFIKQADIVVQPSRYEGKSIVLDEAKVLGKPIVVTNYTSVKDQIENDVTGVIVEMNPESIADGIIALYQDQNKMKLLSENCRKCADNADKVITKFLMLFGK